MMAPGLLALLFIGITCVLNAEANPFKEAIDLQEGEESVDQEEDSRVEELVGETAALFQKAVREGNVDVIAKFMKAIAKTPGTLPKVLNWRDRAGATALHWCAFYGTEAHASLARAFLLVPGVDGTIKDKHNHTACDTACMKGHAGVLMHLIAHITERSEDELLDPSDGPGCHPLIINEGGHSCLHYAARIGSAATLQVLKPLLTPQNVDTYSSTDQPTTPLYMAIEDGSLESVSLLLEVGASTSMGRLQTDSVEAESAVQRAERRLAVELKMAKMLGAAIPTAGVSADTGSRTEL